MPPRSLSSRASSPLQSATTVVSLCHHRRFPPPPQSFPSATTVVSLDTTFVSIRRHRRFPPPPPSFPSATADSSSPFPICSSDLSIATIYKSSTSPSFISISDPMYAARPSFQITNTSLHFSLLASSFTFRPSPPPAAARPPLAQRALAIRCLHSRPSTSTNAVALNNIVNSGIIACLRAQSADMAINAARAAFSGGISVLEIVVSTPGVFEVLHQLAQDFPTTTLGVGTVLKTEDAESAKNAGAKFIMSPATVKILSSYNAGAKIVKVYPVSAIGGVRYIATLKKPFPHIPLVASQGITTDLVGEYIAHGASSVVLSDAIFDKEAMAQRNFMKIYRLAQLAASRGNEAVQRKRNIHPDEFHINI